MVIRYFFFFALSASAGCFTQTATDADGNVYETVTIGTQVWLSSSLKTTHFSNGDPIPTTIPPTLNVNSESAPLYQWSYNGNDSLADIYGRLYTWYVADDARNVCPVGWHVPSTPEFNILINYLGGTAVAGGKLKQTGYEHWYAPNTGATNETGFNSVGNGNRNLTGNFNDMNLVSDMWSTTEGTQGAWDCDIHAENATTSSHDDPKGFAFAIRCVKNNPAALNELNGLYNVQVYPNPTADYLTIDVKNKTDIGFEILSLSGGMVLNGTLPNEVYNLDLRGLDPGLYILRLSVSGESVQLKFIKSE